MFLLWLTLALVGQAKVLRDIPYAGKDGHARQKLDLHLPEKTPEKPRPVFILIHGGGWRMGDKANANFAGAKIRWLLDSGYLVVSVNYRLSPEVKHPAHVEDVCKAIAWVQKHVSKHGGDPERLYLLGHSAGAHLAALAAVDAPRLKAAGADPAAIRGAVLLDGAGYDIPRQYPVLREESPIRSMYRQAFTDDPVKQRDASPVHRVAAKPPPFLILHVASRPDAARQARLLARALREKGGHAEIAAIPGKTHATINSDCGKPDDPVTKAIGAFLGHPQK